MGRKAWILCIQPDMKYICLPLGTTQRLSFYLAAEEYIARYIKEDECFFMWQVNPSVIFGRNQLIENEVNISYCKEQGIEVYRRKSGGGCVYADRNNIMFSYICSGTNIPFTFDKYIRLVAFALQGLGVKAYTSGRNDILIDGKKVSGNAFYHIPGRNIVHGTMLYDTHMQHMVRSITPSDEKLISKGVQSVRQHITLLKDYIDLDIEAFKTYIRTTLCDGELVLGEDVLPQIYQIEKEYLSEAFLYGNNPRYTVSHRARLEGCGEVEVRLELKNKQIKSVNMVGDYFPLADLNQTLFGLLQGVPYNEPAVCKALEQVQMENIIRNLTTKQFIKLLFGTMSENKKTCLYDKHVALQAQMSPFGGFEMPIQYSGIADEHNAVRHACGIFDVSHMGEVMVTGPDAEKYVQHIFTNDISGAPAGKIFYGIMLYPTGGAVDDLLVYKKGENAFFLVINAANIDKDVAWMKENASGFDVQIDDQSSYYGEVAVQGPQAEALIEEILSIPCQDIAFYTFKEVEVEGETILISRTGYTGEDGFELYGSYEFTQNVWDRLVGSGKVKPCGLGCRDTLRFEVGLPLYGDELSENITPIEAGLGMFVKIDKPEFIGKDVMVKQKTEGVTRKIVGIELASRAIPRHGYDVEVDGKVIGSVTTGYNSISTGKSVCMALIEVDYAKLGTPVQVRIHKKLHDGVVTKKRFYDKNYKK